MRVFVPLNIGFDGGRAAFSVPDVTEAFGNWIAERGNHNQPYVTGLVYSATGVFGWDEGGKMVVINEENAVLDVSFHPELSANLSTEQREETILSLVNHLGNQFDQKRIYVRSHGPAGIDVLKIYQQKGTTTPTQKIGRIK